MPPLRSPTHVQRGGRGDHILSGLNGTPISRMAAASAQSRWWGLRKIDDSFRKIIVVDGVQPFYMDETGVSFVGLMDFMLNQEVLA